MKAHSWKLGDPCFIVDTEMPMRVMPAAVVRISGLPCPHASAMALNPERLAGPLDEEGEPFLTEAAARSYARAELAKKTSQMNAYLTRIPLEGYRPTLEPLPGMPDIGQVVYVLDEEACEVLEVTVGWIGLDFGAWQAGYDSSPGNPEANMVRIREWWSSKESALWGARNRYYKEFAFVPKEVAAKRVDDEIEKIWSDAAERMSDPEWNRKHNEGMKMLIKAARGQSPIAAG